MSHIQYQEITDNERDQRIDNFLTKYYKTVKIPGKSYIYKVIRSGEVRVNGGRVKPSYKLKIADKIRIPVFFPKIKSELTFNADSKTQSAKQTIDNIILYEDKYLLIVNKPSGIAVHKGSGLSYGLIDILQSDTQNYPYLELAHRLDRYTSGCLIFAKNRSTLAALGLLFKERRIKKVYQALVHGKWPKSLNQINLPLRKMMVHNQDNRIIVDKQHGKDAVTNVQITAQNDTFSLLSAYPLTGRTHQIRVHLYSQGYPIVNDTKYNNSQNKKIESSLPINYLCLHSQKIKFSHPITGECVDVQAPLPNCIQSFLRANNLF